MVQTLYSINPDPQALILTLTKYRMLGLTEMNLAHQDSEALHWFGSPFDCVPNYYSIFISDIAYGSRGPLNMTEAM